MPPAAVDLKRPAVRFTREGMKFLTDDQGARDLITRMKTDMAFFAQYLFPGIYRDPETNKPVEKLRAQQLEGWRYLQDHTIPKLAFERWRGGSKSSDLTVLCCHAQGFRWAPYIVYASHSLDLAQEQTEDIKAEICENKGFKQIFGEMRAQTFQGKRYSFGKEAYYLADPFTGQPVGIVRAKSSLTSNRGLNTTLGGYKFRVNLGIWEDVEDEDHVDDPKYCERISKKFYAGFCRAVSSQRPGTSGEWRHKWKPNYADPNWRPPWRIIVADTPKGENCLIDGIEGQPDWVFLRQPYAEYRNDAGEVVESREEGKLYSLVEDISDAQVRLDEQTEIKANRYHIFSMEMLLKVVPAGQRLWKKKDFHHFKEHEEKLAQRRYCVNMLLWDPSRTDGKKSSSAGFCVATFDPFSGMVYVRDEVMEIMNSLEQKETALRLAKQWNAWVWGIEDIGLEDWAEESINNFCIANRAYPEILWLNQGALNRGSEFGTDDEAVKRARTQLSRHLYDPSPGYPYGNIVFSEKLRGGLIQTGLLKFPKCGGYWDILDPHAYISVVMHLKNLHIMPRNEKDKPGARSTVLDHLKARMERDIACGRTQIA